MRAAWLSLVGLLALVGPGRAVEVQGSRPGGLEGGSGYSGYSQVTVANVAKLERAWTFHAGEAASDTALAGTPVVVEGVLYATTPRQNLIALSATTGHLLWKYFTRPGGLPVTRGASRSRSPAWWTDGKQPRLFLAVGGELHAVDAGTGRPVDTFGREGRVDVVVAGPPSGAFQSAEVISSPVVCGDLVAATVNRREAAAQAPTGSVVAYDARTGELRWTWSMMAEEGEEGHTGWPAESGRGRVEASEVDPVVDPVTGLVLVATGAPVRPHWGGDRAGDNLFANCLVALDAATGRRRWHFQFVRHDLWASAPRLPPVLAEIERDGRKVPVVVQVTDAGHVWVLHRETGAPLHPWRDRETPPSELWGERAAGWQPVPVIPGALGREQIEERDMTARTPLAREMMLARLREAAPYALFRPPGGRDLLMLGASHGGTVAVDPAGTLFVAGSETLSLVQMHPKQPVGGVPLGRVLFLQLCSPCHGPERTGNAVLGVPSLVGLESRLAGTAVEEMLHRGRGSMPPFAFLTVAQQRALVGYLRGRPEAGTPAGSGVAERDGSEPYTTGGRFTLLDPDGRPALAPPWGTLTAINLATGGRRWRVPLGGIAGEGAENAGGPLVTAGGLVFIAATRDEKIRAFEAASGRLVWEAPLPAGGYATPITFLARGRQYVVVGCGGGRFGTRPGDAYVAFALPGAKGDGSARRRGHVAKRELTPRPEDRWNRDNSELKLAAVPMARRAASHWFETDVVSFMAAARLIFSGSDF